MTNLIKIAYFCVFFLDLSFGYTLTSNENLYG